MSTLVRPKPDELRAFFALTLDERARAELGRLRDRLLHRFPARDQARPQPDTSLHLTLKFLGNVPTSALEELNRRLVAALPQRPLDATMTRLVAFGTPRHARVVAVELTESTGELQRCAAELDAVATFLGVPQERRDFVPHLTLIRLREPYDLTQWLERTPFVPAPVPFCSLVLYETELTPLGSRYHVRGEQVLPVTGNQLARDD